MFVLVHDHIKSRVDNQFKFLCSSTALKLLLLKSLLLLLSLPNLYKCFSFAQPDIPPHVLCLSYSIYSLIGSSCIEGNLQKMERQWQRKGTNRTDRVRGGHYWVQTNVTVWRQRNLVGESKGFNTGLWNLTKERLNSANSSQVYYSALTQPQVSSCSVRNTQDRIW